MATIVGISGALRRGSFDAALLRAAVELAPAGLAIEIASIREFPLYDADLEVEQGIPSPVLRAGSRTFPGAEVRDLRSYASCVYCVE